jgi:hypothetical protein
MHHFLYQQLRLPEVSGRNLVQHRSVLLISSKQTVFLQHAKLSIPDAACRRDAITHNSGTSVTQAEKPLYLLFTFMLTTGIIISINNHIRT